MRGGSVVADGGSSASTCILQITIVYTPAVASWLSKGSSLAVEVVRVGGVWSMGGGEERKRGRVRGGVVADVAALPAHVFSK